MIKAALTFLGPQPSDRFASSALLLASLLASPFRFLRVRRHLLAFLRAIVLWGGPSWHSLREGRHLHQRNIIVIKNKRRHSDRPFRRHSSRIRSTLKRNRDEMINAIRKNIDAQVLAKKPTQTAKAINSELKTTPQTHVTPSVPAASLLRSEPPRVNLWLFFKGLAISRRSRTSPGSEALCFLMTRLCPFALAGIFSFIGMDFFAFRPFGNLIFLLCQNRAVFIFNYHQVQHSVDMSPRAQTSNLGLFLLVQIQIANTNSLPFDKFDENLIVGKVFGPFDIKRRATIIAVLYHILKAGIGL